MSLALTIAAVISAATPVVADAPVYRPPTAHSAKPPRSRFSLTIPLDPPMPGVPRPQILGRANRPLVVIDAGHGGHDPGAVAAGGAREKDVTLAMAKAIRDELLLGGRVRVALTRDDDTFLILQERAEIARGLRADLFISVHADAAGATEATGATVYTLSEVASNARAAQLAARENKADVINGVNLSKADAGVSSILIDLAQRETINASSRFAALLKRETRGVRFRDDFHQMAGFAVLKAPDMPAVLLEVGYISNVYDLARITSREGRTAIAQGLRRAVDVHFARRLTAR
jgi:N-acetylmuramoyl-L-alanine amidase